MSVAAAIPLLIVEDNPVYADILQRLLPTIGADLAFDILWVDSAEKAVWELEGRNFELMLLDYKLPGADGLSVLAHVRSLPEIRQPAVIMLTGIGREEIAVEAMKRGAKDYLSKDQLDVPSLLRAISGALERKRAEGALAEERALIRALLDSVPDCIYFKDTASRFTRISRSLAQVLGVPRPEDAIGKTDADFLPADYAQLIAEDDRRILTAGEVVIRREEHLVRPGNETWFSSTKVPLHDRFGNITGLVGISRDVTDRKRLEAQLARTAEELHAKNEQLAADIELAREVQEAFLPQHYPRFPTNVTPEESSLRFCHHYQPTIGLGGDFFDVLPLSDTQAGVFICDVMGHGVRAALVTAIIRALVEELRLWGADAGRFLTALNNGLVSVLRQTKMPIFASAFYLVADVGRGEIRYSNAGHPSALCLRRGTGLVEALDFTETRPGPALGVFHDSVFPAARRPLAARDAVLLYTDGIFEVAGPTGEHFGLERFAAAVLQRAHQPTAELMDGLVADVRQFAGGAEFADDVCLVGVDAVRIGGEGLR
jgi:phosphoserine phosphatase RsbU/P